MGHEQSDRQRDSMRRQCDRVAFSGTTGVPRIEIEHGNRIPAIECCDPIERQLVR